MFTLPAINLKKIPESRVVPMAKMAELSTYKIGGRVAFLVEAAPIAAELNYLINWAAEVGIPWAIIGNGSNILMPDEDQLALIIKMAPPKEPLTINGAEITVYSGVNNSLLAQKAAEAGLAGLGFLYDIPGTVGGGVVQNAGMNEESLGQLVLSVTSLSPGGETITTAADKLAFGYRESIFKHDFKDHLIISARLKAPGHDDPARLLGDGSHKRA